jgi:endonuclease YncB( thermonuclease family)
MYQECQEDYKEKYSQHGGSTPFFTLNGLKMHARVCDVYDGDTITLVIDVNGSFLKFKTRLTGIDACEMKSLNIKNKDLAIKARNRLIELITHMPGEESDNKVLNRKSIAKLFEDNVHIVWVHCFEFDKYGRLLADCYESNSSDRSFAQILNDENLAYTYNGETKLSECQQVEFLTSEK